MNNTGETIEPGVASFTASGCRADVEAAESYKYCSGYCLACTTAGGCGAHQLFTCATCGKLTAWSDGADDECPMDCACCWGAWLQAHGNTVDSMPQESIQ